MELAKARPLAENIVAQLTPHCSRIEIAGSIRRGKPEVHDIDIVAIPTSQAFYTVLNLLGNVSGGPVNWRVEIKQDGKLIISQGKPFTADIYIATESTWATLLLIRTGSKEHNMKLCKLAQSKGMKLHADGSGLSRPCGGFNGFGWHDVDAEMFIPCPTETEIFAALGLAYVAPGGRE